jgi:hypothetical protein
MVSMLHVIVADIVWIVNGLYQCANTNKTSADGDKNYLKNTSEVLLVFFR